MGYYIEPAIRIYFIAWIGMLALSFYFVLRNRNNYEIFDRRYWAFLFEPWKVATFLFATFLITIAAPYSDDHTWDTPDSILISIVTYFFAPWAVATGYKSIRDRKFGQKLFVALTAFFIPCWTYDFYILLRDQVYLATWLDNLFLSSPIVFLAGLFWNLLWVEDEGVTFAFKRDDWPTNIRTPFKKIFWVCVLLGVPVAASIGWFVITFLMK